MLVLRSPRALIDPCAYAWLQRIFKMHTHESRSKRALRSHCPRIRLSRRITIQNSLFLKRLLERDSSPCEHSQCYLNRICNTSLVLISKLTVTLSSSSNQDVTTNYLGTKVINPPLEFDSFISSLFINH